jgi:hypothetical protein
MCSSLHFALAGVFARAISIVSNQSLGLGLDGEQIVLPLGRLDLQHGVHPAFQRPDLRRVGSDLPDVRLRRRRDAERLVDGREGLWVLGEDPVRDLVG